MWSSDWYLKRLYLILHISCTCVCKRRWTLWPLCICHTRLTFETDNLASQSSVIVWHQFHLHTVQSAGNNFKTNYKVQIKWKLSLLIISEPTHTWPWCLYDKNGVIQWPSAEAYWLSMTSLNTGFEICIVNKKEGTKCAR